MTGSSTHQTRLLGYLVIFCLYYGLGIVSLYTFGESFMNYFAKWIKCPSTFGASACYGTSLILRISMALTICFFLLTLLMLPKDEFSYGINKNCWIFKFLLPVAIVVGFFFVDNSIFVTYANIAKYAGIVYLLFQNLAVNEIFIRFANRVKYRAGENGCYQIIMWTMTVVSLALNILLFVFEFSKTFGCGTSRVIVFINVGLVAANYILTFFNWRNDVNFLSTSTYSLYFTYFIFAGLSSNLGEGCTELDTDSTWSLIQMLINILIIMTVLLAMKYSRELPVFETTPTTLDKEHFNNRDVRDETAAHQVAAVRGGEDGEEAMDHLEYRTYKYVWIFLSYFFLCMYFLSVLTNYGQVAIFKDEVWAYDRNQAGFYIQFISGLFSALLYLYILVAPLICKNREFGYKHEEPKPTSTGTEFSGPALLRPKPANSQPAQL